MAVKLLNRVMMSVASAPGTGSIPLGAALPAFQSFAAAGIANNDTVHYVVEDGNDWEIGVGTYSTTGPTLARTSRLASSTGSALVLSENARVMDSVTAETLNEMLLDAQSLAPLQNVLASRNALATDRGKMIYLNHATTPVTYTIPADLFPAGTYLNFVQWQDASGILVPGAGVGFFRKGYGVISSATFQERYASGSAYTYGANQWLIVGEFQ